MNQNIYKVLNLKRIIYINGARLEISMKKTDKYSKKRMNISSFF